MPSELNRADAIEEMETACRFLRELGDTYPKGSMERSALKQARFAYSWIYVNEDLRQRFLAFFEHIDGPPTEEELARWSQFDEGPRTSSPIASHKNDGD
jgi:hypothetical protein